MRDSTADSAVAQRAPRFGVSRRMRERLLAVGFVVLWLLFWGFSIRWGLLDDRFFLPPSTILNQFLAMWLYDYLGVHIAVSVQRLVVGYLLETIPALLLGIIIGRNQWLRAGCGPLLVILASFPALAVYPVIMIIVGLSEWSKWIIVVVSTFFIMLYWTRTVVAVRVNAYLQVATGAGREAPGRASVMRLGWVKPYFLGLKLAAWVGLLTLIPAEFVGAKSGIGYVIWMSWQSFHVAQMYVGIALAGALGRWRGWPSISWSG